MDQHFLMYIFLIKVGNCWFLSSVMLEQVTLQSVYCSVLGLCTLRCSVLERKKKGLHPIQHSWGIPHFVTFGDWIPFSNWMISHVAPSCWWIEFYFKWELSHLRDWVPVIWDCSSSTVITETIVPSTVRLSAYLQAGVAPRSKIFIILYISPT